MKTDSANNTSGKLSNDIGIVTEQRVIIYQGKDSNVIQLEQIQSINLTKKRMFFGNVFFLSVALTIIYILCVFEGLGFLFQLTFSFLILITGLLGVLYKFYSYRMTISLKDEKAFTLKASQFRKEQMKNFHYLVRKKLRKNKLEKDR